VPTGQEGGVDDDVHALAGRDQVAARRPGTAMSCDDGVKRVTVSSPSKRVLMR
jgi:hypothetical protein